MYKLVYCRKVWGDESDVALKKRGEFIINNTSLYSNDDEKFYKIQTGNDYLEFKRDNNGNKLYILLTNLINGLIIVNLTKNVEKRLYEFMN